ncbi:MAG TPA: right-handed parallel beta-helix repeat-containing protein [Bryobacteraceae bacterium]|nr:right-handed parallel beta-helix repeat-containing protein [Bryobacteraceae bacterium]
MTGGDESQNEAAPVTLWNSGTPAAWITIQAEHKWKATLDCEMLCDAYIDLRNASYVLIQNFVITHGYKEAIHSNDAAHHIMIEGNRIEYIANRATSAGVGLDGMYTNANCHDFIVDANVFHDIGRTNASQLDHGLYLRGRNYVITNNVFYNIAHGWSIQMADGLSNVTIANNTFAFPDAGSQGGQIMMWNTQFNVIVRNNIFFQSVNSAIARFESVVDNCAIDHNLVFGASTMMRDSTGCTSGSNQLGVDPRLVNTLTAPYDFHLSPSSPAIAAGAALPDVVWDFDGNIRPMGLPYDVGAYTLVPRVP